MFADLLLEMIDAWLSADLVSVLFELLTWIKYVDQEYEGEKKVFLYLHACSRSQTKNIETKISA